MAFFLDISGGQTQAFNAGELAGVGARSGAFYEPTHSRAALTSPLTGLLNETDCNSQTRMPNDEIRVTNQRSHNSEHFDIRASDFFRHSSFVIQGIMQIRFMVRMRV